MIKPERRNHRIVVGMLLLLLLHVIVIPSAVVAAAAQYGKQGKIKKQGKSSKKQGKSSKKQGKSKKNNNYTNNNNKNQGGQKAPRNCLTNNRNPYRTCLSRPNPDGSSSFSWTTIVHDFATPNLAPNEEIRSDIMYMALLQDDTRLNCQTIEEMEELVLSYLADNVGGREFEPVCVQILEGGYDRMVVPGGGGGNKNDNMSNGNKKNETGNEKNGNGNGNKKNKSIVLQRRRNDPRGEARYPQGRDFVESNTIKMRVSYVHKLGGVTARNLNEVDDASSGERDGYRNMTNAIIGLNQQSTKEQRALQRPRCTNLERAQCCSQTAINGNPGRYCLNLGCKKKKCGGGRRRRRRRPARGLRQRIGATGMGAGVGAGMESSNRALKKKEEQDSAHLKETVDVDIYGWEEKATMTSTAGRRTLQRQRGAPPPFSLKDADFANAVRRYTAFQPAESEAHLDVRNVEDLAACTANWYSAETFETPTLECEDFFQEYSCPSNDDIRDYEEEEGTRPCLVVECFKEKVKCERNRQCCDDLFCNDDGMCSPPLLGEGDRCDKNSECSNDLTCNDNGRCAPPTGGEISRCDGDSTCEKGLVLKRRRSHGHRRSNQLTTEHANL